MVASDATARFGIQIDSNATEVASQDTRSLEGLRDAIMGSKSRIAEYGAAMRNLRGTSDEVKAAKDRLKNVLEQERAAISKNELSLINAGTSSKALADKQKELARAIQSGATEASKAATAQTGAMSSAISGAGGPVASLKSKFEELKGALGNGNGAMVAFGFAATAAVAIIISLAQKAASLAVGVAKFAIEAANAARTAGLMREAVAGSAQQADALGSQVDALARKVPTARGELDELGRSLRQGGLGGQVFVDSLNAISQASAALGQDVGSKVRGLIDRGKLSGRFQLSPQELFGSGLDFRDVASSLAKEMHVSVDKAKQALLEGRVKLGDGATALRMAIENKVGGINARRLVDLDTLAQRLRENFQKLASGIRLDGLLNALSKIVSLFDSTTVSGAVMKQLMTSFGNQLVSGLEKSVPVFKAFIQGLVIGALILAIAFQKVEKQIRKAFGDKAAIDESKALTLALGAGVAVVSAFAAAVTMVGIGIATIAAPFIVAVASVKLLIATVEAAKAGISAGWKELGEGIIDGLTGGIFSGIDKVKHALQRMGEAAKTAFKTSIDSHSPSKEFHKIGKSMPDGTVGGVEEGTPAVQRSVDNMVTLPKGMKGGGAGGGGGVYQLNVTVTVEGGGGAQAAPAMSTQLAAAIKKAFEEFMLSQGLLPEATT